MKKTSWIIIFSILLFFLQAGLFSVFGGWFKPNFLLLFIIYLNLTRGIRYGLLASLVCGLLMDSFGTGIFGIHAFSFFVCSYLIAVVKKYFIQFDVLPFKIVIVSVFTIFNILFLYLLNTIFIEINFKHVFLFILFPETVSTVAVAPYTFDCLKKCASKLYN